MNQGSAIKSAEVERAATETGKTPAPLEDQVADNRLRTFGRTVRTLRHVQGMSQARLGELAGFDQNMISKTERGKRDVKFTTICALAEGLGVSPAELVSERSDLGRTMQWLLRRESGPR